ncbi:hypothetical protein AYO48_00025 [Gaiella sp. SCGC AG-212-M14]|nr:hypothetical protein AYO48_00025 [Gaiella sp. SCGC AG-212-M14]
MAAKTKTIDPVGLLAACDDAQLLSFPLWPMQRELLANIERGPRVHVWALGRRSGKTTMAALACLWDALLSPELRDFVRPGERRYAVAVATNLRQARLIVRAARSIVERSPLLSELIDAQTDDEIAFKTGVTLAAFPCTSRGGRGWPISTLVMDEAAHFVDTDGNSAADSVWRALVPSTAQFGDGARIIVASTPFGAEGLFADLHAKATAGELEDALAAHHTSAEMNPRLDAALLSRELARDPENFKSEYLAEFLAGGGSFLDAERIAAAVLERGELGRLDATGWVLGLDLGFASDPTGIALVAPHATRPEVLRLGLARGWQPQRAESFEERREIEDQTLSDVADLARHYGARIVADSYLAPAVVDFFRKANVSVQTIPMTAESKTLAYQELRARLNAGTLELYDHPGLLAELRRLRTRYAAGKSSVVNPRVGGSHGDIAQAFCLAVWEHDRSGVGAGEAHFVASTPWDASPGSLLHDLTAAERMGATPLSRDMRL